MTLKNLPTLSFEMYSEFNDQSDPSLAEYYSNSADIQNTLILEDGSQKHKVMPAPFYLSMLYQYMGLTKALDDRYSISNVEYKILNNMTVVTYIRCSYLKDFSSPVKIIFGLEGDDEGVIFEE